LKSKGLKNPRIAEKREDDGCENVFKQKASSQRVLGTTT